MSQNNKRVPKLRFPEFSGELEAKLIRECVYSLPTKKHQISSADIKVCGKYPVVDQGKGLVAGYSNEESKLFVDLPIIIFGDHTTELKIMEEKFVVGADGTKLLKPNSEKLDTRFLFFNIYKNNISQGGYKRHYSDLKEKIIHIPILCEQTKIAQFFTLLDDSIQTQEQIIENLEQLKKGYMQKIFSQQLRFKDENCEDFPEWEEVMIGDIAKYRSSNLSIQKLNNHNSEPKYPVYNANGIFTHIDYFDISDEYITFIKDGAGVGRLFLCEPKSSFIGTMGSLIGNNCNTLFLYYLLSTINFDKYTVGGAIPHIYFRDFKSENVSVPCHKEQLIIGYFFKTLDLKIKTENQKLEKLNLLKSGYLQQMFI